MKKAIVCFICVLSVISAYAQTQTVQTIKLEDIVKRMADENVWIKSQEKPEITRTILANSIEMARTYMLNHQKEDGSFIYAMDIESGEVIDKDNQVRQAGALWGLSSLNRDRFNEPTRRAVILGINFFETKVNMLKSGKRCFVYPKFDRIDTGAVALFSLSLIEFLRGQEKYLDAEAKQKYTDLLNTHLDFLRSMEMQDGSWAGNYNLQYGIADTTPSPYYDGECTLAYCKAARYLGRTDLLERIDYSMPLLIARYTIEAWKENRNSEETKGFYQWGCMAFAEYAEAGWEKHKQLVSDAAKALTWWLLYETKVEYKNGNTGYSVEGLMGAYRIAKLEGDTELQEKIKEKVLFIMANLMSWQYKGPFMKYNPMLSNLKQVAARSDGGITMAQDSTMVRIDIVQHQLHAMLLMMEHLF